VRFWIAFPLTGSLSFYIMDIPRQRNGKSAIYFFFVSCRSGVKGRLSFRTILNTKAINAFLLKILCIIRRK